MADSADSPRLAALRGLEQSLHWHREAQASRTPVGAPAPARASAQVAPEPEHDDADDLFIDETIDETPVPIHYGRRSALRAFLGGRVMRRVFVAFAALFLGRMPKGLRDVGCWTLRVDQQTYAYTSLLTDKYPQFGPTPEPDAVAGSV